MSRFPHLWLTSMSGPDNEDNIREMVEPILPHLDGIIWVLHDCPVTDTGAQYLEAHKGMGTIIHRRWPARHWHSMNDTLFAGIAQEGDMVLWSDTLERPMPPFVSRIQSEIGPMMNEADLDVIFAWGKPFLLRYRESMQYKGSPHWWLEGWNGRGMEWSKIEADETKVRFNARPLKRPDPFGWVNHYMKYWVCYPAGSNHALLGLEKQGDPQKLFPVREAKRLAFREELRKRGVALTLDGVKAALSQPLDEVMKGFVNGDKTINDYYRYEVLDDKTVVDTHLPSDMVIVP